MNSQSDPGSPLFRFVQELPHDDLLQELERIREERNVLDAREALVKAALAVPEPSRAVESKGEDRVIASRADRGPFQRQANQLRHDAVRVGTDDPKLPLTRDVVVALLAARADKVWTPAEVSDALEAAGYDVKRDSVRVMLQRLLRSGPVERPRQGHYRISAPKVAAHGPANEGDDEE